MGLSKGMSRAESQMLPGPNSAKKNRRVMNRPNSVSIPVINPKQNTRLYFYYNSGDMLTLNHKLSMLLIVKKPECIVKVAASTVSLLIALYFFIWMTKKASQSLANEHTLVLDLEQTLLHTPSERFLSFGLDTSLLRNMNDLPLQDKRFITLARYLGPAYVRIGGTSADCLLFDQSQATASSKVPSPVDGSDISNFTITAKDFISLYTFTKEAGLRMLFDLNVLIRNPLDNSWNISNAKEIISFAAHHGMLLDWQLGNEPNSFHHVFNISINADQLAQDYIQLRKLLDTKGYANSIVVGPEVNHIADINGKGQDYAKEFLIKANNSIAYVTWHQYYLNGRVARVDDFINPETFNILPVQINAMKFMLNEVEKDIDMWLSETSTAFGGGAPELSDRFVGGFLWLDKLGYSALSGLNVVIRQSYFGGNYAMVGPDVAPNPDWWVSVIFKQFVSEKVLELSSNKFEYLRLYAHCTPQSASLDNVPAITIYGVNINSKSMRINIEGIIPAPNKKIIVSLYALTSDHLQSRNINLNGEVLNLRSNGHLPPFKPVTLNTLESIELPSYSMIFLVIHHVNIPVCSMS
ncbi:heparanase isoform X2 [Orussus abietinus]|uniref:heparanase isoform X2 n=1 Tax=Orussus abietinus TaxID=222816 RepID=UPI0006264524|nr:heparanase isoform X2 [Orussus abietinus]